MPTLIMMQGLPASGKTTEARRLMAANGYKDVVRVSKDDLRKMLFDGRYSPDRERIVKLLEVGLVRKALLCGLDVIVDDTNLLPSHWDLWSEIAKELGATFTSTHLTPPIEECIQRDAQRENPVGAERIMKMEEQHRHEYARLRAERG